MASVPSLDPDTNKPPSFTPTQCFSLHLLDGTQTAQLHLDSGHNKLQPHLRFGFTKMFPASSLDSWTYAFSPILIRTQCFSPIFLIRTNVYILIQTQISQSQTISLPLVFNISSEVEWDTPTNRVKRRKLRNNFREKNRR
ncbi:hypothetical protein AVEN_144976-1 [Araneus ventricosus]|uniref:Uncharacterized protein n=1 Tax=Araneus ventricosus TaxID=182803 RepID=A0A4Y2MD94_ARAVE|nr:hypothetical protein AVEN_144976-1 [Araneus ventricosus]